MVLVSFKFDLRSRSEGSNGQHQAQNRGPYGNSLVARLAFPAVLGKADIRGKHQRDRQEGTAENL
jgi:hypothetical protein